MESKQSILYLIPKQGYYDKKPDVIKEGIELHNMAFEKDRELYTYLLYFQNATYYSKSLIIENLLKHSLNKVCNQPIVENDSEILGIEDYLINKSLMNENITHAFKLLLMLKNNKVNNKRTTRTILRFLFDRGNSDMIAIKYKAKFKALLVHSLGLSNVNQILQETEKGNKLFNKLIAIYNNPYSKEVFFFVFGKEQNFKSTYLQEYCKYREAIRTGSIDFSQKSNIPIEVLQGFNNTYKKGFNIVSLIGTANTSKKQKIQLQNTVKKQSNNTVEIKIDLTQYSILELLKYMYNKKDLTVSEKKECEDIIDKKTTEIRNRIKEHFVYNLQDAAIIVDFSDSNNGSKETRLHPMYKSLMLSKILDDHSYLKSVGGEMSDNGFVMPSGDTDLSTALLEVVEKGYKNIIVISDGYENINSFDKTYKQLQKIGYGLNVIHFNPVFSPKNLTFKSISSEIIGIPFTNEKDVEYLALFCLLNTNSKAFKKAIRTMILKEMH